MTYTLIILTLNSLIITLILKWIFKIKKHNIIIIIFLILLIINIISLTLSGQGYLTNGI